MTKQAQVRLAPGAMETLMAYDWPGNVRELENVIERAMILHRGAPLRFDELGGTLTLPSPDTGSEPNGGETALELDAVVASHIRRVLRMTKGKIHGPGGAAEALAVNANTLRYRMGKLGIPFRKREVGGR